MTCQESLQFVSVDKRLLDIEMSVIGMKKVAGRAVFFS